MQWLIVFIYGACLMFILFRAQFTRKPTLQDSDLIFHRDLMNEWESAMHERIEVKAGLFTCLSSLWEGEGGCGMLLLDSDSRPFSLLWPTMNIVL